MVVEVVAPVINLAKNGLQVKSLVRLKIHSHGVQLTIENHFFVQQSGQLHFNVWIEVGLSHLAALLVDHDLSQLRGITRQNDL